MIFLKKVLIVEKIKINPKPLVMKKSPEGTS